MVKRFEEWLKLLEDAYVDDNGELHDLDIDEEESYYLYKAANSNEVPSNNLLNFPKDIRKSIKYIEEKAKKFGSVKETYVNGYDRFSRGGFIASINDYVIGDAIKLCLSHNRHYDITSITIDSTLVYFMGRRVNIEFDLKNIEWDEEIKLNPIDFISKIFNIAKDLGFKKGYEYLKKVASTKNLYFSKYYRLYQE